MPNRSNHPSKLPNKNQLIKDVKAGLTEQQIADKYGVQQPAVSKRFKKDGIQPNAFKSTGRKGGTGCDCRQPTGHLPNCSIYGRR